MLSASPSDSECFMDYTEEDGTDDPAGHVVHELPKHNNVSQSVSHKTEDLVSGLTHNICLFILKVRERHCVPAVDHASIVDDLRTISDSFLSHYSEAIRFHLQKINIRVDDDDDLSELLSQTKDFEECVRAINTEWTLGQYCCHELGMVKPIEIHFKSEDQTSRATFQYIPLLNILQRVAENEAGQC